jgi:hypothetical protein
VAGHVAQTGKKMKAYRFLWKRKIPLVRHGHKGDIILNSILREIGWRY